jgi:hypothetical protein
MRTRLLAVLCLLGAVFVLGLSGCGGPAPIFQNIPMNLDNYVNLPDVQVSVRIPPEVYVNHPFTVTASLSAPHALTSLSGSGANDFGNTQFQAERLDDLLRPTKPYTGSYSLCLIASLQLDDESDFDIDNSSGQFATEQDFTLVPDVTTVQTAQWTLTPRDTLGFETVLHNVIVLFRFDAQTTCHPGNLSLLNDWFNLTNSVQSAKFTVVNDDLRQQRAITAHLQPIAVAAVAAGTTTSVAWAVGVFEWLLRPLRARRKQGASEKVTHRRATTRSRFIQFVVRGGALLSIGLVLIMLGPSTLVYALGTNAALGSFFGGIVVACAGIVVLAIGVRRIRLALWAGACS